MWNILPRFLFFLHSFYVHVVFETNRLLQQWRCPWLSDNMNLWKLCVCSVGELPKVLNFISIYTAKLDTMLFKGHRRKNDRIFIFKALNCTHTHTILWDIISVKKTKWSSRRLFWMRWGGGGGAWLLLPNSGSTYTAWCTRWQERSVNFNTTSTVTGGGPSQPLTYLSYWKEKMDGNERNDVDEAAAAK